MYGIGVMYKRGDQCKKKGELCMNKQVEAYRKEMCKKAQGEKGGQNPRRGSTGADKAKVRIEGS